MNSFFETLKTYIEQHPPNYGDGESVLTMLYEAYAEANRMDDDTIKKDFNELYRLVNGMTLTQMDAILDPVCKLCRDHQRSGFVEGICLGVLMKRELILHTLPLEDANFLFNLCCSLCGTYEHKAYIDGVQYGACISLILRI